MQAASRLLSLTARAIVVAGTRRGGNVFAHSRVILTCYQDPRTMMSSFTGGASQSTESFIQKVLAKGQGVKETTRVYDENNDEYDRLLADVNYQGPQKAADMVKELMGDHTDIRILDIGAGTGLQAEIIHSMGYTNIDALDGSEGMLEVARKKNIYNNLVCHFVGDDPMPFEDNSYDLVVLVGTMGDNHLPVGGFRDIVRVAKPGAYIVNVFREGAMRYECYGGDLNRYFMDLETEGLWSMQSQTIFPNYTGGADGMCMIHKVL